jgi:hypothetical protein
VISSSIIEALITGWCSSPYRIQFGRVASVSVVSFPWGYINEGYSINSNSKIDTPFIELVITGDLIMAKFLGRSKTIGY